MIDFINLNNISAAISRRSILAISIAIIASGCASKATNDTYDLRVSSPQEANQQAKRNGRQLLITEPTALKALDSENILIRVSTSEIQYLAKSQWSDRLPKMVQSKLVVAFENSGRFGGVGRPGQGLAIDYQVMTEIRSFEIDAAKNMANVEIYVKLVNDQNGTVKAQKLFKASVRTSATGNNNMVKSLDSAFASVSSEIVKWSIDTL